MLKGIGTGITIASTTPPEVQKPTTEPAKPTSTSAEPAMTSYAGAQMKSDIQLSASLQQAALLNQLDRLPLTSEQAQKEASFEFPLNEPLDSGAQARLSSRLTALQTGDGNDHVVIQWEGGGERATYNGDDRVQVMVNGQEAWSGTHDQFQRLTIDTGGGDDVVNNNVDGATIVTGEGNDVVTNKSNQSSIFTGNGDDRVVSEGDRNLINTGDGNDSVYSGNIPSPWDPKWRASYENQIDTGEGDDVITVVGNDNVVQTGGGKDSVESIPWTEDDSNIVDGEKR